MLGGEWAMEEENGERIGRFAHFTQQNRAVAQLNIEFIEGEMYGNHPPLTVLYDYEI